MAVFEVIQKVLHRFRFYLFRGSHLPVFLGLLSTFLCWWLYTSAPPAIDALLDRLDNVVYDQRFNLMLQPIPETDHKIIIIDYDQKSLEAEGQWPWSRFKLGDLVARLANYGVLVIGFDVWFPEYERNLITELQERIGDEESVAAIFSQLRDMEDILDADKYFSEQMQYTDVVLGFSFRPEEALRNGVLPEPVISIADTISENLALDEMQGYVGNVDILQSGAAGAGFFDTSPDLDGIIRRSPLIMLYLNHLYPSLALEMARLYYLEDNFSLETELIGSIRTITGVRMGQILIPTDRTGRVLVPFVGPSRLGTSGSYTYISATDVLRDTLSKEEVGALENSLVLIGSTATGLYDLRSTPLEGVYPGVEIHANILNAILRSSPVTSIGAETVVEDGFGNIMAAINSAQGSTFPSKPDWERGAVIFAILLIGILLSFIYPILGPALLAVSSLAFMLGLVILNFKLWTDYSLDISLVILLFLILFITIVNMSYGFLREGLSRRTLKGMFDQYVPPAHIDAMLDNPENYNFEGESKDLSVLFSDIRDFTSISESLSAAELKTLLNDFFTPITGIIFDHNGTIDKYVGDMVMAFWGAPLDDPDHRTHAVLAALKMLEKVEALKPEFVARGLPEINVGIGINSGFMNVGDMGSTYRRSYTVLGDAVNLSSRLEGLTKFYGVKLLIGEETYDNIKGFLCRLVDRVQVKGKEEPIRIYQPLCRMDNASKELIKRVDEYNQAYEKYVRKQWDEAEEMFKNLKRQDPETMFYDIYLERISDLREHDLESDWDGIFRHTEK